MKSKKLIIGVILIISSSIIGWSSLFLAGALAPVRMLYFKFFFTVYLGTWITFGLGFFIAGKEGLVLSKEFFSRLRNRRKEEDTQKNVDSCL